MSKRSRWLIGLNGLCAICMVALLANPFSRWVVWSDVTRERFFDTDAYNGQRTENDQGAGTAESKAGFRKACASLDETAQLHAADAGIQVAFALRRMDEFSDSDRIAESAKRVRPLLSRFPNSPIVWAAYCRLRAPELIPESGKPAPSAEAIADFQRAARKGEDLDPHNAFFPFMMTMGFVASGANDTAIGTLHGAAGRITWEDYSRDEAEGVARLIEGSSRKGDPFAWPTAYASMDLPHLSAMRRTAIDLRNLAVRCERSGRPVAGIKIRHDLIQLGARMRDQSHTSIGSRVGMAIERIAILEPGGARRIARSDRGTTAEITQARLASYTEFLRRSNAAPSEARWVATQTATDARAGDVIRRGTSKVDPMQDFLPFGHLWGSSLLLFWGIVGSLTLTGAAWGITRLGFVRNGEAMRLAGRWGFWLAIVVFPVGMGARHLGAPPGATTVAAEIACVIAFGIGLARRKEFLWQTAVVAAAVLLYSCYLPKAIINGQVLILACAFVLGRRTGEPAAAATVRTVAKIGPFVSGFALLLFSAAAYSAGVHYRAGTVELARLVHDENRVFAAALHQRWPQ